eukprot:TRINITY_DN11074_c0_g1_i1.p1 TRINITY_DN11074_c0_g1~~TRINITY_DN11074_c0_g1_i1.p1  ORF type:complete len:329 (+),score=64.01 TRINITY_DN11074_c0_g1_i1:148-1134(+)
MSKPILPTSAETDRAKTSSPRPVLQASLFSALLASGLYLITGPSLILVNKYILVDLDLNYPLFLSSLGSFAAALVAKLLAAAGKVELKHKDIIDWDFYLWSIFPVAFLNCLAIGSGNVAYLYLTVSFIQMLKSITPAATMALLTTAGLMNPSPQAVGCVTVMTLATAAAAQGELNFNIIGLACMLFSVTAESTRMLMTQKLFTGKVAFSVTESQYYLALPTGLSLLVLACFDELPRMWIKGDLTRVVDTGLPAIMLCLPLAVGVIYSSFFVIKTTNTLMLKLLAAARNAGLVLFSVLVLAEQVTIFQGWCYAVTLLAFVYYSSLTVKR